VVPEIPSRDLVFFVQSIEHGMEALVSGSDSGKCQMGY
jgi:hypothetical protein